MFMILLHGCSVFDQASQIKNFARCEFRLESVEQVKLGGVNIQGKNGISDLGVMDYAKITGAVASGSLPLTFNLNVRSKNPNPGAAAMNKMEWILFIDDIEMTRGILNDRIEIPAQGTLVFPVALQIDLMKALSGKSGDALLNFGFNLSGSGSRPMRITLKAKPTIYVGNSLLEYPGYITVTHEYGG
jgi:hypothetical protein